jgi:Arc/MetJ-type ribon-helix-helix transcriptional regulator
MALTVRLGPKTERMLDALARRRRQTRSDVVREALETYAAGTGDGGEGRPYDQWADVIGVIRSSPRAQGKTTGERFTDIVRRKARARRAR